MLVAGGYWITNIIWAIHQHTNSIDLDRTPEEIQQHQQLHQQQQQQQQQYELPDSTKSPVAPEKVGQNTSNQDEEDEGDDKLTPTIMITSSQEGSGQQQEPPKNSKRDIFWWRHHVSKLARVWEPRTVNSWCREFDRFPPPPAILLNYQQVAKGMIYIKVYKSSSSTCEGIARSIAHRVGTRLWSRPHIIKKYHHLPHLIPTTNNETNMTTFITCRAWTRHEFANHHMQDRRHPTESILWTFVRNPIARDLSHIYHFEVGRKKRNMTSIQIREQIHQHMRGLQTRYLATHKAQPTPLWPLHEFRKNRTKAIQIMKNQIFDFFDFIGMTERMSESLACMVLLWGLRPQDVIVLNAKRSGGYDDGGGDNNTCTKIPKAPPNDELLQDYFTNRFPLFNGDVLLYHTVNASLELTMDVLGRDRVQNMAKYIEELQSLAQSQCEDQAYFPCSPDGIFQPHLAKQSCYVQDSGCGYQCVQRVLANMTLPPSLRRQPENASSGLVLPP